VTGTSAERQLLGSLMLDPESFSLTVDRVSADDFSDQRLGAIFAGIERMVAAGEPVNSVTVTDRFAEWKIRGLPVTACAEWTGEVATSWRAGEFADSVRDAATRRGLADISRRYLEAAQDPSWHSPDAVSRAIEELEVLRQSAASRKFIAKRLADILEGSDEYDWLIPGLLERRDRLVVTGAEGAGKTTFVRQLAILSAAGLHPLKNARIKPVRVLVVDAENTESQWRRAVRWMTSAAEQAGAVDPAQEIRIMAGNRIDITRGSHLGEIHRLVDEHKPDMLLIGPLYRLVPKAINNDDDAAPLIVALDSLRDRGLALVMEAHAGHALGAGGERDLRPRGSAALLGWPEFGFGLRPLAEDPDFVSVVRWRGDRDQRDWPRHLRRGLTGEWSWVPAEPLR
jgi:hypothetical protein